MHNLYEHGDILNRPIEFFYLDKERISLPVAAHWHYFIELIYVIEGSASIYFNQQEYCLKPGQLLFLPPQAIHVINNVKESSWKYALLKFDANRLTLSGDYLPKISSIFRNTTLRTSLPVVFDQSDFGTFSLHHFFENNIKEINEQNYGYDAYLHASISQLIIQILRVWRRDGYIQDTELSKEDAAHSIHDILMYIDQHSHENINVSELAEMCNMSYSHFAKTFHKLYGQSCKEYIEFIRLNKVENLLLFTNYDLNYISAETGFADCSHLIRIFKRKYKITPKQFRLQHSKSN